MSKRLQVLLEEAELLEIQRIARGQRMTLAEWVRQALRAAAQRRAANPDASKKLSVIRSAALHGYPSGDLDGMLAEIEKGYRETGAP